MAGTIGVRQLEGGQAQAQSHPLSTTLFDWTATLLSVWMTAGLYLDGWAHNHGRVDNTFFTPWHAVLYGGVFAVLLFLLFHQARNMLRGASWQHALPVGYGLSLLGALLFVTGGALDMLWHELFGVEANLEALLSPTHLLLAASGVLIVSGPVRAIWPRLRLGEPHGWRVSGPAILSMMLLLSALTFFTQFAHPFNEALAATDPAARALHSDIFVMNADGAAQTRLTVSASRGGWGPAWSPDGRRIAFSSSPETDPDAPPELYVMNADGTGPAQLTHNGRTNYLPSWSPDGTKIAFSSRAATDSGATEIYVMGADGDQETRLTDNDSWEYGISWSPDGTAIVFGALRNGEWQIYRMDADGSHETQLTAGGGGNAPAWSPDGSRIAFTSGRFGNDDIFVINSDGTNQLRLTENDAHDDNPAWSPDGSKIVFSSDRDGTNDIYAMNADGSGATNLSRDASMWNGVPAWSPDGKRIAYTAQGNPERPTGMLRSLGIAGILLQSGLLMGVVLFLARWGKLPFGAMTLIVGVNSAMMTVFQDQYELLPAALLAGLIADVLYRWLRPSETRRFEFCLFAVLVPVVLYSLYYLTLQLTGGIAWTIHLWLGSIVLAGIVGLFVSFLLVSPLRTAGERARSLRE